MSAFNFVDSKKRNHLTPERENDVVYTLTKMSLGKRYRASASFAEWDKGLEMSEKETEEVE